MAHPERNLSSLQHGVAGAASGMFTRFTCQPFDVIKIRFQIQTAPIASQHSQSKYTSMYQAVARISREEGMRALWKGHIPAQWLSAFYGAAQFTTYEIFTKPWKKHSLAHFGGGAISGIVAVVTSFPFDVIRTRLVAQGEPKVYRSMMDAGSQIIRVEGWKGLFKGLTPACIHTAPLTALIFGFNHILTTLLLRLSGDSSLSAVGSLGCGAIAGFTAKTAVYPFDLVKKRLQLQGMPEGASASGPIMRTSGLVHCLGVTLRSEGIRGLYKGLAPSLLKASVSNAVYLTSYDLACQFLEYQSTER